MKNEIVLSNWQTQCPDRCCDDFGCEVFVNGVSVTRYFTDSASSLQLVLEALGIEASVTEEWDDYVTPYRETLDDCEDEEF